jgi:serine/threonine protein kinase
LDTLHQVNIYYVITFSQYKSIRLHNYLFYIDEYIFFFPNNTYDLLNHQCFDIVESSKNAEYGYGSKISTEGDVYSYGILILAMLTGKQPTDESFSNGLSLHRYVGNVFPQRISEILDPNITQSIGDVGVDNNLEHEKDAKAGLLSRIIQLIKLGLSCSMEAPKDRPTMLEVCAEVTAIKQAISAMCIQE